MARSRRRQQQQGQAIVLIALLLVILFGMLGLAIDSGRAYVDRRQIQNAVDAATRAAGDDYENFGDQTLAFNNATTVFERVLTLGAPSSSSTSGNTYTANFPGGYTYQISGANGQFNGYVFQATASSRSPSSRCSAPRPPSRSLHRPAPSWATSTRSPHC